MVLKKVSIYVKNWLITKLILEYKELLFTDLVEKFFLFQLIS